MQADQPFCRIPERGKRFKVPVFLPPLDAVVGNPPYVRKEEIDKFLGFGVHAQAVADAFKGMKLSGRTETCTVTSGPHAARFLKEGRFFFGFLTSSQWLDVDYGFKLQRWILREFQNPCDPGKFHRTFEFAGRPREDLRHNPPALQR